MKNKSLKIFSLSILMLVVLMSVASAALTFSPEVLSKNVGDNTITITSDDTTNETLSLSDSSITDSDGHTITFSFDSTTSVTSKTIDNSTPATLYYNTETGFQFDKDSSLTISSTNTSNSKTLNFENTPIPYGDVYANDGNLKVNIDDLNVESGFGPDDDEWYPLDEIKAKINVENNGDKDIKNIVVSWGLYDESSDEWIVKGKESKFKLKDDDDETLTVNFQVDKLSKLKDAQGDDFKFYAWATGEDEKYDEEKTSTYDSEEITIDIDDDFVILNNLEVPESVSCGDNLHVTANVVNIGDSDENDVYVVIYNKELGINQKVDIGDIDSMEDSTLDADIALPENVEEKSYILKFYVYDEDDDVFENDNSDKAEFGTDFKIEEGSCSTVPQASVSADLLSEAKAGEELDVSATIVNTGSSTKTFNLDLTGYSNWASLESLDKNSVTLNSGDSVNVLIKLKVNDDVSGDKSFSIQIKDGDKVLVQPVSVTIEKQSSVSLTGLFSGLGGDNWYLWGIGALNILLILIIIVVAVKVSKRKE